MTRTEIKEKIATNYKMIGQLREQIDLLQKEEMLLSDDVQQYYEKEVEVIKTKRPKVVEKQLRGFITWKQNFIDEHDGSVVTIERNRLVRINGKWL